MPPVGSDPNGKNIRPYGQWHQMLPAVAYDPAGHSTVCHGDGIAPHGTGASCSIPRVEVAWSKLRMPYGQVSLLYDYMEASFSLSPVCCVIPASL